MASSNDPAKQDQLVSSRPPILVSRVWLRLPRSLGQLCGETMVKFLAPPVSGGEIAMFACVSAYACIFRTLVCIDYFIILQN